MIDLATLRPVVLAVGLYVLVTAATLVVLRLEMACVAVLMAVIALLVIRTALVSVRRESSVPAVAHRRR